MFKDNLKNKRLDKKLKQKDLEKLTGISRTTINRYENGKLKPNIKHIILLASEFGCNIDELVEKEELAREYKDLSNMDELEKKERKMMQQRKACKKYYYKKRSEKNE